VRLRPRESSHVEGGRIRSLAAPHSAKHARARVRAAPRRHDAHPDTGFPSCRLSRGPRARSPPPALSLTRRTRRSASPASPARRHPAPRSENTLAGKKLTFVDPEKVANNARVNDTVFQFLSIVSGIVCGILGYTDLKGLGAFFVFNCVIGAAVCAKLKGDVKSHFPSWDKIFVAGASASAGTFILFWTLFYNICHLF
jgi:hypothetical protein